MTEPFSGPKNDLLRKTAEELYWKNKKVFFIIIEWSGCFICAVLMKQSDCKAGLTDQFS